MTLLVNVLSGDTGSVVTMNRFERDFECLTRVHLILPASYTASTFSCRYNLKCFYIELWKNCAEWHLQATKNKGGFKS